MTVVAPRLLQDLKRQVRALEADLRTRADSVPEIIAELKVEFSKGRDGGRIGDAFEVWREEVVTQAAVHWVLGCVFVRFLEDNALIEPPLLAGPGPRGAEANEECNAYFRHADHRTHSDRDYLLHAFRTVAGLPAGERLFDSAHNPLWSYPISADAARDLLAFWRTVNPDTGELTHDFTDSTWDTRFLGDLYQDLSDEAKARYALLQTPAFVESLILDRTLDPAMHEFGLAEVKMIDPTCGSGHFLLGAFTRLLAQWQQEEPGTTERVLVQRALDAVHGVDVNPFAVAIARFRLLIAALQASRVRRLAVAPDYRVKVVTADSLLFGKREGHLALGGIAAELQTRGIAFHAEDADDAERILSERYHAVVGNPPYITVKNRALNKSYRELYSTCHMKYALSVPFIERFWQLAVRGVETRSAGFVGMINANSFMKREFGKKVVEQFFPRIDLTHVIDTSGAYIPGHGTPTVILFGRNRGPVGDTVRAVMGIKGEPSTPADPAQGEVWSAIVRQVDRAGGESMFVSVADAPRIAFAKHPWSIAGGGAVELMSSLGTTTTDVLGDLASSIGFMSITGEDDVFMSEPHVLHRNGVPWLPLTIGDDVRDWENRGRRAVVYPYNLHAPYDVVPLAKSAQLSRFLWPFRTTLRERSMFGKRPEEAGRHWFEYMQFIRSVFAARQSLCFAFVATHNHFLLHRGDALFNRSAPTIRLLDSATDIDYVGILGLLNSSIACFWMKHVFHNKGSTVDQHGARQTTVAFENFYEFTGTGLKKFPLPSERPVDLAMGLELLARERQQHRPGETMSRLPVPRDEWLSHRDEADRLLREMIAIQEELDWQCYQIYAMTEEDLTYRDPGGAPLSPPEVSLGERAFEIALARRVDAGEEETTWFQRHKSTPVTQVPAHWTQDYRLLVERRIQRIQEDRYVGLVERPEYKRRWNVQSWDEQASRALEEWLKTRLESARHWPEPRLQTTHALAARVHQDREFMAVADMYRGHAGFDVHVLVRELAESEVVPFLPRLRFRESGLRKREVWERTWARQRREDQIDALVAADLKASAGEDDEHFQERLTKEQMRRKKEVGDIPRPPKYTSADFGSAVFWRLCGALDVPKERFISYPLCSRDNDPSLLLGWAGWDHLQQAEALAARLNDLVELDGWPAERLMPVLAGLEQLLPWLEQWHNEPTPEFGRLGDFYRTFLQTQLQQHGLSAADLKEWKPPARRVRRRTRRARA